MTNEHNKEGVHSGTVVSSNKNPVAILAYLGILIIIPFLLDVKNEPFVKYHLKQGLVLLIFDVIGWFVAVFIGAIPMIGWFISTIWSLASLVYIIIGVINVLQGQEKELPFIGQFAKSFTF